MFFALCVAFVTPLFADAATDPLMLPIKKFDDGFNTNNIALAKSSFAKTGIVILDEIPPHNWSGPAALTKKIGSAWFISGWSWNGMVPKSGP